MDKFEDQEFDEFIDSLPGVDPKELFEALGVTEVIEIPPYLHGCSLKFEQLKKFPGVRIIKEKKDE